MEMNHCHLGWDSLLLAFAFSPTMALHLENKYRLKIKTIYKTH